MNERAIVKKHSLIINNAKLLWFDFILISAATIPATIIKLVSISLRNAIFGILFGNNKGREIVSIASINTVFEWAISSFCLNMKIIKLRIRLIAKIMIFK